MSEQEGIVIESATADDADTIALLMTEAFLTDPTWSAIFPIPGKRGGQLKNYYREAVLADPEWVDVARDESGQIVGALIWEGPSGRSVAGKGLVQSVSAMLQGLSAAARRGARHDAAVEAYRPDEPHWYLHDLATSPKVRGRGLGSRL